jgi:hypothetical protein
MSDPIRAIAFLGFLFGLAAGLLLAPILQRLRP